MSTNSPVDYQAALEAFRKEEHKPDNPVRSPERIFSTPITDVYVDYQAAAKAWDKQQAGKYVMQIPG